MYELSQSDQEKMRLLKINNSSSRDKITAASHQDFQEFIHFAIQAAHDLKSPLSALTVIAAAMKQIPEEQRNMIRDAAKRICDIANELGDRGKAINDDRK